MKRINIFEYPVLDYLGGEDSLRQTNKERKKEEEINYNFFQEPHIKTLCCS